MASTLLSQGVSGGQFKSLSPLALALFLCCLSGCSKSDGGSGGTAGGSADPAATTAPGAPKVLALTDTEVTVGQLHSATGTMAISETGSIQAEQLAIEQINESGGILGRKVKIIQEDGASDWPTFAEKSKKLLVGDRVAAVFGC